MDEKKKKMVSYEITAMTANMGHPSGGKYRSVYTRRDILNDIIQQEQHKLKDKADKSFIVFAQEIGSPKRPPTNPWNINSVKEYKKYSVGNEAGIAWHPKEFKRIKSIAQTDKEDALNSLISRGSFVGGRTAIVVLEHTRSRKRIICVSWHGRSSTAKASEKESELYILLDLVNELLHLERKQCHAAIISGDFNIEKTTVQDTYLKTYSKKVKDQTRQSKKYGDFVMVSPRDPAQEEKFKLDFFLWRGTGTFTCRTNTRIIELTKKQHKALDHNPAVATFSFKVGDTSEAQDRAPVPEDPAGADGPTEGAPGAMGTQGATETPDATGTPSATAIQGITELQKPRDTEVTRLMKKLHLDEKHDKNKVYLRSLGNKKYAISCDLIPEKGDIIADFECTNPSEGQKRAVKDLQKAGCKFDGATKFEHPVDKSQKDVIEVVQQAIERASELK